MRFEICYKCGKNKLASFNMHKEPHLTHADIEMTLMTYGKNKNSFCCKDCKVESEMIKKLLSTNIIDIPSIGGWSEIETLKKYYKVKKGEGL